MTSVNCVETAGARFIVYVTAGRVTHIAVKLYCVTLQDGGSHIVL